jgi:hypothetical protein
MIAGFGIAVQMSTKLAFGIGLAVAGGLGGIIALELRPVPPVATPRAALPVPRDTPPVVLDYVDQWLASVLARPLFNRSRQPSAQVSEQSGASGALPRLAGTLVSPYGNAAIFAGTDGSKPIVVHEGERVADYIVQSIQTERVTVRGPDGERVVHISYEAELSTTPPASILSAQPNGGDPLTRMRHAARYDPGPQQVPAAPIGRFSPSSESSDANTDP